MTLPRFDLIGLPTDINSSFARGAAAAPAAIRAALFSDRGNAAAENGLEIGVDFVIDNRGDLALDETPDDDARIRAAVRESLDRGAIPLLLGGDHAVTYPIVEAIAAHHGAVTILHFDAHPDLYDDFEGNPRSHASPFARIMEQGLASRLIQIGIRTLNRHCREQIERFGVEMIEMRDFATAPLPKIATPCYISLDLDALDPGIAPGVSHPEPGGLSLRDVLHVLDAISGPIIGADIVELNPRFDRYELTAITAAKLVREIAARGCERMIK